MNHWIHCSKRNAYVPAQWISSNASETVLAFGLLEFRSARTHKMFRERSRISLNIVVACINGSRSNKKRKNRGRKDHIREGLAAVDVTVSYILNGMSAIHWILQPVRSHIIQKWDESSQKGKFWSNINKTLYENTI